MTAPTIPHSGPAFETMMLEIDTKLAADGIDIASRPFHAVREVSLKYQVSIPLAGSAINMPPELLAYLPLSDAIDQWYRDNFGDRLKVDPCPGRSVLLIDKDLYVMRVPRLMGSVHIVTSREFLETPEIGRGPVILNVVQTIEAMTRAKAARLTDDALSTIRDAFERAVRAAYFLEDTQHELMFIARGDVATAVDKLMAQGARYGKSKWASLQAAEKVLKAAIALHGRSFKYTHGLKLLAAELKKAGVNLDADPLLDAIQCKPGIRYGEEPCGREDALRAHHASLDLVIRLRDAGAKFDSGLGFSPHKRPA